MDSASVLKDEYVALRAEICQSIAQQHHILISGYGATAAVIGFVFGSNNVGPKALFVIPIILLGMISLWAVECNRMVRASYYIADRLWPAICDASGCEHSDGWEVWIRIQGGHEGDFRKRQNVFQQIAVLFLPFLLSLTAIIIAASSAWEHKKWLYPITGFGIVSLFIWGYLFITIPRISDLGAVTPTKRQREEERTENAPVKTN